MKLHIYFLGVTFLSISLSFLTREVRSSKTAFQSGIDNDNINEATICHKRFMSVFISKENFTNLPFAIYVQDDQGIYYQAVAIAQRCHYFIGETESFVVLTVAYHGCFVRRQKPIATLLVAIGAIGDRGIINIITSVLLICIRQTQAKIKKDYSPSMSTQLPELCDKDGFNININQNVTVPPLNLDTIWIPSSENCKPKTRSSDAVNFNFPFTDCGTQSMKADGVITYWVNIEAKGLQPKYSIFRDSPFRLTVHCSFTLSMKTELDIKLQGEKSEHITLMSEGILRAELRFAKDSSYTDFYTSRDLPVARELGQPVYVEVYLLKHKDKDQVLLLQDCWATPSEEPHSLLKWMLLVKGCPFSGDSYRTVLLPVVSRKELKFPSLHKWFMAKMFSFEKQPSVQNLVYFHCNIEICKGADCLQHCTNRSPRLGQRQTILSKMVSGGPLIYERNKLENLKMH